MWPYETMWTEDGGFRPNDERRAIAEAFFEEVEEGKSLAFFYVDERNPLFAEDGERSPHRVLVGISRIKTYEKDIREWNEATWNGDTSDALGGPTSMSPEGGSMSKLKLNITMSIDGFVAGPDQSPEHPLGVGGEQLHDWLVPLKAFREGHGEEGGEVNASTPFAEDILGGAGATIMGRNMFGGGPGPWDESWKGWWGDNPPFHHPVFVLTNHPRKPLEMQGGTTFHFVTDGIESALEQARAAAGEKEVSLGGGASVAQQYLAAGLLDEIVVSVVPILLGGGTRLFENVGDAKLEQVESVEAPGVTHIRYARA